MSGDISSTEHKSEEMESNNDATEELKKARQEYCRTKGEQEKKQLTSILQNVSKEIKTLQLKEKHSSDGNLYPEVSKMN